MNRNTITLGANRRIVITPVKSCSVMLEIQSRDAITNDWETRLPLVLDEGTAGLLVGGIEIAFDELARRERASLQQAEAAA